MEQTMTRYLKELATLERNIYAQDRLIKRLSTQAAELGHEKQFYAESKTTFIDKFKEKLGDLFWLYALVFLVASVIGWLNCGKLFPDLKSYTWTWDSGILWLIDAVMFLIYLIIKLTASMLLAVLPTLLVFVVISVICMPIAKKLQKEENMDKDVALMTKMLKDQDRVDQEMIMKERLLEELQMVKARRQKTKSALDALYGLNIIDEEYRGLIPIHTIYGYFRTGRCTQLQGHEGAYNLYAIESRLDRIVVKLDVVISKLDEIRENQYDLFRAMTDTNNLLSRISRENHRMSQSLDTIKENSELIAFNVQANNDQIRAIANMMFFRELMRK